MTKLAVTVLRCRRCERMVKRDEVTVTNLNEKNETWRCPHDGGVCDAIELSDRGKNEKVNRGRAQKRKRHKQVKAKVNHFLNTQRSIET